MIWRTFWHMVKNKYFLEDLDIGDIREVKAATPHDVKRIAKAVSIFGIRKEKGFRCRTDRKTRIMTITRVR